MQVCNQKKTGVYVRRMRARVLLLGAALGLGGCSPAPMPVADSMADPSNPKAPPGAAPPVASSSAPPAAPPSGHEHHHQHGADAK